MPVWQKAMELSIEVFNLSSSLPRSEDYGFTPLNKSLINLFSHCINNLNLGQVLNVIYHLTGLTSQIRRSTNSISANIACPVK
ncbi:MAG: four helix bundle protein [Ignavibacteria bacterium]|nr:four helix bundle protein [Ignavibacteria bacterium]